MLIVAMDFSSKERALSLAEDLKARVKTLKVGAELFLKGGFDIVNLFQKMGFGVFLDLKFFDIPNTVMGALKSVVENGVLMTTLHSLMGKEALRKISEFNAEYSEKLGLRRPLLIGVTILTSMDERDLRSVGINCDVLSEVLRLAEISKEAGLDGVVCSPHEVEHIKREFGEGFITVVPGIRPAWSVKNDQKRTLTPSEAKVLGADYIVVGRPITASDEPKEAADRILKELAE